MFLTLIFFSKLIDRTLSYRAISNKILTSFSLSPRYLEVNVEDDTLKKVVPHSVATALAKSVLPVPGGPTISTPRQGRRMPATADLLIHTVKSFESGSYRSSSIENTSTTNRVSNI